MARLLAVMAMLAVLWGYPQPAGAHPMSRDAWSLRTAVQLAGEKLDVVVVMEVPFAVVAGDLRPALDEARKAPNAALAAEAAVTAYAQRHFSALGKALTVRLNGAPLAGTWRASANRLNGKGAVEGGFFLYIVEFVPKSPPVLGSAVRIEVDNAAYPDPTMVYSVMVHAGSGWSVSQNSAAKLLPSRPYDLNAPDFWVSDPALRKLDARFVKAP